VDVALTLAETARRGLPDSLNCADTLGWAYFKKGSYSLAVSLLEEVAKKDPKQPAYHYHLGMAYLKSGDKAGASAQLQQSLQLDPKSSHADDIRAALIEIAHN
jgi:Flp pilus assembly protein TadD